MTNSGLERREFLGLSLAALAGRLHGAEPRTKFPEGARDRLSVSTYPFRSVIASPHKEEGEPAKEGLTLAQFAATVKAKLNVPGIEPWSHHFESTEPEYLRGLSNSFGSAGLHVVNIPVDIGVDLCSSAEKRAEGLSKYRHWVDGAVILGSPSIRVHMPHGEKDGAVTCAAASLGELARYGESKNIVINIENDEPQTEQPERVAAVIKQVGSPYLRALPDFCNSMLIHNDQQYNNSAMKMLFPLAYNISHVKDMESDEGKVYRVNPAQIFAIANAAGYRGYFSMEWEGSGDPYAGTKALIEASLQSLG